MQAHEQAIDTLMARFGETPEGEGRGPGRVERALSAYLDALAAEPAFSRLFLLEVYAAGPAALEHRAHYQRRFTELVNRMFGARSARQRFAGEALVATTSSLVTARLAAGDLDGLRALRRPLAELASRMLAGTRPGRTR